VVVTAYVAAAGVVTQHAGGLEALLLTISIPPTGQPVTVGSSCTLPQDMNVIAVAGHMHRRGSHFRATSGGMTLLESDEWDGTPPRVLSPPLPLKAGADLTWSCDYTNDTGAPLTLGNSALTNVMCNAILVFYPIPDVNNELITCNPLEAFYLAVDRFAVPRLTRVGLDGPAAWKNRYRNAPR